MALLEMTTFAEIRAVLGVNDVEISDETLGLELYSSNLAMELDDVNLQLQPKYAEVRLVSSAARTDAQSRFFKAMHMLSTYIVAKQCCISLPMFGPKSISDSKTDVSRFNDSPYKETMKAVTEQYKVYRQRVVAAHDALMSASTARVRLDVMAVSTPSSDPVTG